MDTDTIIAVGAVAGTLIVVVLGIFISIRIEKKRTEAFAAAAGRLGLEFYPEGIAELIAHHDILPLFSKGRRKRAKNYIRGERQGIQVGVFDYRYTTGGGAGSRNSHTWHQTVVSIESSRFNLPDFTCSPENIFAKIGSAFGYQDIDFDSHPEFSRKFLLRGSDESAIRTLFHSGVLEWFEQHLGITTEAKGDIFVFFRAQRRVKPEEIGDLITDGLSLFKKLTGQ